MTTEKRLPKTPSILIKLALDDLNKVERFKGYRVDMNSWHLYSEKSEICAVCLAGAVMVQTLKAPQNESIYPSTFPLDTNGKLAALDFFRLGSVGHGFNRLGLFSKEGDKFNREIPNYRSDRPGFKRAMRKLVRDLKAAGL